MNDTKQSSDIDEMIAALSKRRDVFNRQIENLEALRLHSEDRQVQILLRYVVLKSMKNAALWANDQGWRMPGTNQPEREYTTKDVKAILDNPPSCFGNDLMAYVRGVFDTNLKSVNRTFN